MKIVFLTDEIPPDCEGGAGFSTFLLAEGLKKTGDDVFIISGTKNKDKHLSKITRGGTEIFYIHNSFNRKFKNFYSIRNARALSVVKRKLEDIKPDVVHAHNIHNEISFAVLRLAKKYVPAVFFTARDSMSIFYGKYWQYIDYHNLGLQKNFNYKIRWLDLIKHAKKSYLPGKNYLIRRYLNKYCDKVFAVSDELGKALKENGIANVQTIYNGVRTEDYDKISGADADEFREKYGLTGKKIIFCVGRLNGSKGIDYMLRALAIIKLKLKSPFALMLAMKHENYRSIRPSVENYGLNGSICRLGWLDEHEIKLAYKAGDVVVVPSVYLDPFPRVNLEAMAAGKPVVGTCFGGTPEAVIDGETGYIVNPLNVELMAEKIIDLLENPAKAKKFGQAGYDRVKREFTIEKQAEKTRQAYLKSF
ncbi:MAG: glycosyltransferase family 4 protein [bacterium]